MRASVNRCDPRAARVVRPARSAASEKTSDATKVATLIKMHPVSAAPDPSV